MTDVDAPCDFGAAGTAYLCIQGRPVDWLTKKFELSRGGSHNERPMEGLRGFAVFLVFLAHFASLVKPWISSNPGLLTFAEALNAIGSTGVDLFFVLSGYLIYGSLISHHQNFLRFMSRRIRRIYPTFTAVFAVYVFLSFLFPSKNKIPSPPIDGAIYLIENFLLLPGLFPIEPMITVAWSLSYEMFYYLAIPLVILLFRLRDRSVTWRMAFFLSVVLFMMLYCDPNGGHVRLIMFISGIVLHESMTSRHLTAPSGALGFTALVVGLLSTLFFIGQPGGSPLKAFILFVAFFTICLTCFGNPSSRLPYAFSWTPLRWLGNMSYSYYLIHGLALKTGFLVFGAMVPAASNGPWLFWILLPSMFVLTLLPSVALFLLIERPFSLAPRRIKRRPQV